jgi:hypothetical protein
MSCCNNEINNNLPGNNAYTKVKSQFTVPAVGSNVTINVLSYSPFTGEWAIPGQIIFIENAGFYEVISSSDTQIVAKNLGYLGNALAGTIIIVNSFISPGGLPGINTSIKPSGVILVNYTPIANQTLNTIINENLTNLGNNGDTLEIYSVLSAVPNLIAAGVLESLELLVDNVSNLLINSTNLSSGVSTTFQGNMVLKSTITRINSQVLVIQTEGYLTSDSLNPLKILSSGGTNGAFQISKFLTQSTANASTINIKLRQKNASNFSNFYCIIKYLPKI